MTIFLVIVYVYVTIRFSLVWADGRDDKWLIRKWYGLKKEAGIDMLLSGLYVLNSNPNVIYK